LLGPFVFAGDKKPQNNSPEPLRAPNIFAARLLPSAGGVLSGASNNKTVVLRTANVKEETFRVQNDAVIESSDSVMIFSQFEPQAGAQITLYYEDPLGMVEVSRIKH
jgi:hypothetical protein